MSDGTKIEWADASWPVVTGCTHVSDGCDNCYAAKLTGGRLRHLPAYAGLAEGGRFNGQVRLLPDRLGWPLRWRKPRKVFVSDMADLFHEAVPDEFIARVFAVMALCPQHTFQVLTKRHARLRSLLNNGAWRMMVAVQLEDIKPFVLDGMDPDRPLFPLPNVWLGVSAEDQHWADIRIPALLGTPAAVRFVSAEPLLAPVTFRWARWHPWRDSNHLDGLRQLDWVIIGGESGPRARPCELGWIEEIVNECHEAGVPVFVKQFGKILGREFGAGSHGADWEKWPPYLQHRHFPVQVAA